MMMGGDEGVIGGREGHREVVREGEDGEAESRDQIIADQGVGPGLEEMERAPLADQLRLPLRKNPHRSPRLGKHYLLLPAHLQHPVHLRLRPVRLQYPFPDQLLYHFLCTFLQQFDLPGLENKLQKGGSC